MLILPRKVNEKLKLGDNIEITILELGIDKVRIGIETPKDIWVHVPRSGTMPIPEVSDAPVGLKAPGIFVPALANRP